LINYLPLALALFLASGPPSGSLRYAACAAS